MTVPTGPDRTGAAALDDLRARLRATRWLGLTRGVGWDRGTDPGYLRDLVGYWASDYDWRAPEERSRALPWVPFRDGWAINQVAAPDAPVVVLLHGWPDSFLRFQRVLPLLADVTVVVPCLPGYPFGPTVPDPGAASRPAMAEAVHELLAALGHQRYVVCGGDIGSAVAEAMALGRPDRVPALHLTDVSLSHLSAVPAEELTDEEREYQAGGARWSSVEGGYLHEQSTRPHTLAVGLGDSPAGLAAWIAEKLRAWSDCEGDVERAFPRDDLLTWVTLYWLTGSIGPSFAAYFERPTSLSGYVETPTAVTLFPHDLMKAPRSFAERFLNVRSWREEGSGGHFAAWEQPELFVAGVRRALDLA